MKHLLNILLILLIWNCVFSQSQNQNYIKTTKFINDSNATVEIIQYYDGLGRPIQTVQKGITPNHADLVSYTEYDDVGREWKNHLPIIGTGNGSYVPLSNFSGSNIYDGESRAYSEILYEHSPLNRVIGNKGPGSAWQNNPTSIMYEANNNEVRYYYVNESGELKSNSNYPPSSLYKTTTKDEDNKSITEYKDKLGRIVMQRHGTNVDTYYVYNDLGQLSYVLPPLAADANGSEDAINKYGYVYKYDERGNCIYKKLPGCEYIRMAYDKANRMIISQDGNQRKKGKVLITRYDIFGRIAYVHVSHYFPNTNILNLLKTVVVTEEYNGTGLTGYTEKNHGVPMRIEQLLTVNYYDNYQFVTNDSLKYTQKTGYSKGYTDKQGVQNPVHADLNAKGMLTGTRTYQLDNLNNYTTDVYYYDNKGNLVQQRSTNHLGGYDFVYNDLDFNGKPNKTLRIHTSQGSPPDYPFGEWSPENISELYTYYYDHAGRILKTTYKLNNGTTITLSDLTNGGYDELGRLISKKRHNGTDTESFEYNIRNQPTKIQSGTFVQNLYYTSNPTGGEARCYNGNIAQTNWTYGNTVNYYSYTYDELNRLEEAVFENLDIGADKTEMFIYDKNGNTIHIARLRDNDYMDMLEIDYNGNQIKKITDIDGDQGLYNVKEYRDLADKDIEFYYDANGNLVTDLDRDIVTIRYNILNLPELIQFKNGYQILNKYDAAGKKLSSQNIIIATPVVVPIGEINTTYDPDPCSIYHWGAEYVGNIEYAFENDCDFQVRSLDKIYNSEGYVVNVTTNPKYCYYRRDHLGNNREVWVGGNNSTIQHTQYYATGLPWANGTGQDAQQRKYNGKEWIEAHGLDEYDSQARMYYPAIMRTTTIDPLAEKYYHISPYAWCGNNPVNIMDLNGMDWYQDPNGIILFSHYLNEENGKDLTDGFKYLGATYTSKSGNNYRKDGSIMFKNEQEAYDRLWWRANSFGGNGREMFGIISEKGILVLPDNIDSEIGSKEYNLNKHGYRFDKGKLFDAVTEKWHSNFLGIIHTHQDPTGDARPSHEDIGLSRKIAGKPIFTMGHDEKVHGVFWTGDNPRTGVWGYDFVRSFNTTNSQLMQGKKSLILFLKTFSWK